MSEHARRAQRGLSIIEVLVGMVIALIISLAAAGSAKMFGAAQRQGISVGGVSVGAATAISAIKNEASSAGLGFFGTRDDQNRSLFSCHRMNLTLGGTVRSDAASFVPVRIGTSGANNSLDVVYATSIDGGADVLLSGSADASSAQTMSRLPVANGQLVMLVPGTASGSSQPCLVRTVTSSVAATDDTPQTINFGATGVYNQGTFSNTPSFDEEDKDRVVLLGTLRWSRFAVNGTTLVRTEPLTGTSATLLRNVMSFRVQYGVSTDGVLNDLSWQDATGTPWGNVSGDNVNRIRALRIGLVTRSLQRERPDASGTCQASTEKPRDPLDAAVEVEPDVAAPDDWRCYRYRSELVVVPLRNLVW
ncbi:MULTISPECIES: PilW family protein [unclassified Rubrivivax]|uniref:PilW family protein n=1 Tax=unclassified Rubrivivax TaxID=2649762 RepID=UPI001E4389DA|nr:MULTISPECIES: PilW family protein [unclassified Rubrivivax]MCC9596491.1 PilW family protein [Rubrivivax sp. JA1055]MCC9648646.1 PilW family protein [Rubrivivax sp. JA1029]